MSEPRTSCCVPVVKFPHGQASRQQLESEILKAKIARAEASGPRAVTQHATIMDISPDGTLSTLREGSNQWTAFPGNENQIGNVPMCCDPMGLQWVMDILEDKPRPTNSRPGLIYMLCGATQHSNVDHTDHESPPIPIGPHYMIIWPFDSKRDGLPNNVRDAGSWVMFDGSPFAYLHVCGSPWEGTAYDPRKAQFPIWSMRYAQTDRETEEDPQAFWWDDLLKKRMKRDG